MAAAKQSPPVVYLFCPNPECNAHVAVDPGAPPPNSAFVEGATCPFCEADSRKPPGKIQKVELEPLGKAKRAPQTVVALPGKAYGGFALQRGDDDSKSTWGGTASSDSRHERAQYVTELQLDLLRLGYYGPARGGEKRGVFGLQLMANVLNLKMHLANFYGVSTFDPLAPGAAASPPTDAIHFPAGGLASPGEVFDAIAEWTKLLGESAASVPLEAQAKKYVKEWNSIQAQGLPAAEDLPALRIQTKALKQRLTDSTKSVKAATDARVRFTTRANPLTKTNLSEEKLSAAESALDELLAANAQVAEELGPILVDCRAINEQLPGGGKLNDPGDELTFDVPDASDGTLEARLERVKGVIATSTKVDATHQQAVAFARARLSSFPLRIDQLGKRWGALEKLGTLLRESSTALAEQLREGLKAALRLNVLATATSSAVPPQLGVARRRVAIWIGDPAKSPATPGSVDKVLVALSEQVQTNDFLAELGKRLAEFREGLPSLAQSLDDEKAKDWGPSYKRMLVSYGSVDAATATFIRRMVIHGELLGKKVFLTPMNDEIQRLAGNLKAELPGIVDEALPRVGRAPKDGPVPILEFIYNHESGGNQSKKFAGREFTTLGIDWPNKKTGNASFDEEATPARKLSTSRGWGATQFTLFEGAVQLLNESGTQETYVIHAGIPFSDKSPERRPLPLALSSARQNLIEGTSLFLRNFTGAKRECSFEPSGAPVSGRSYDCKNCAKRLKTGPSTPKPGGIKSFDDAQGDFERVPGAGPLYRIRTLERLRELLSPPKAGETGVFQLPGGRDPELANEADLLEFPCSWLASIIRYSGVSRRGFDYMLEAIDTMKSK